MAVDVRVVSSLEMGDTVAVWNGASSPRHPLLTVWLPVGVIAALTAALYSFTVPDLVAEWWNVPASSYGLLIPPLAVYIAYLKRQKLRAIPAQPEMRGLGLVALACLAFLVGGLAAEFYLARISVVLLLAGFVWTFWGSKRLRALAFPFVLLATMVPLPIVIYNALAAPLQLFASSVATSLLQSIGVSVFCQGNIIHLANTTLGVAEACSGLQSLSALMVASLLLGFLESASFLGRILLFVLAAPLAIAVNVLRVAGTAILADYRLELAMGFYHSFSGWLVFLIGFGVLWLMARILFRWTRPRP